MKKIFISFVALMALSTSAWAAGTLTKLGKGRFQIERTMKDIATEKGMTAKGAICNEFDLNSYVHWTSYGANVTFYNDGANGCIYESQNSLAAQGGDSPSKIYVSDGYMIESITITYGSTNNGVISMQKTSVSPVPLTDQIKTDTARTVNGQSISFYVGRNISTKSANGRCDMSKITVVYYQVPTKISLSDMTVSLGSQFQLSPDFTPSTAFALCEWESDNNNVVSIDKNGVINAKTTGKATITASWNTLSATCELTVVDNSKDKSMVEDFSGHGTIKDYTNSVQKLTPGTSGFSWGNRNIRRSANDMIDGKQGVSLQYRVGTDTKNQYKNYFAYADAKQEGGIKRISFQWRAIDSTKNVMFQIDDCTNNPIAYYSFFPASAENLAVHTLTQDVNYTKNFQFRVKLSELNVSNVVFGPMTITPYLLYKTKTAEVNGKYTNTDLINNTPDTATVVYTLEGNDGEASIDAATGEVTCLAEGEVTVRATWGAVSTTYTLKTHILQIPEISFEAGTLNKDIYDAPFTNLLTTTPGVGDTTYTSSDTTVATIDANGQVTILAGGTTTITASLAATETYAAKSASYVLNVDFKPAEGAFWRETFNAVPQVLNFSGTDKYVGDSSVYNWAMTFYQRQTDDMVGDYQGTRIRYSGALAMDGVQEGGIKAIRFDYRAANQVNPIHFKVNVDGVDYEYNHAVIPVKGAIVTYAQKFEVKKNTQFSINMDAEHEPAQAYPIFGPITIAPYLLYTTKLDSIDLAVTTTYKNVGLIDNRDNTDAITYSIVAGDCATVNPEDGTVTATEAGEVTVQAKWGDVTTTYTFKAKGSIPTNLMDVDAKEVGVRKVVENGQLYIIRNAKTYNAQGKLLR